MNAPPVDPADYAQLESDGTLILSEKVMADYVMQTPGCKLWHNHGSRAIGLRLLRGVDDPPYLIERKPSSEGTQGRLNIKDFADRLGLDLGQTPRRLPCRYYPRFRALEVAFGESSEPRMNIKNVLDDFQALED